MLGTIIVFHYNSNVGRIIELLVHARDNLQRLSTMSFYSTAMKSVTHRSHTGEVHAHMHTGRTSQNA